MSNLFISKNFRECLVDEDHTDLLFSISTGEQLSAFEVVVSQLLEDVQERLVYRAQVSFMFSVYQAQEIFGDCGKGMIDLHETRNFKRV